jgi:hypothetical protein
MIFEITGRVKEKERSIGHWREYFFPLLPFLPVGQLSTPPHVSFPSQLSVLAGQGDHPALGLLPF